MLFNVYFRNIGPSSLHTIADLKEMVDPTGKQWLADRDESYDFVATVDCNTPEEVFIIMQSDDAHWSQHDEVKWSAGCDIRSMMVGDVVIIHWSGDELLTVGDGFVTLVEGKRKFDWSIGKVDEINPLGQEIIDHIHRVLLKQDEYKSGTPRKQMFELIENLCINYFKTEGLAVIGQAVMSWPIFVLTATHKRRKVSLHSYELAMC
jgi:hypothetical protein